MYATQNVTFRAYAIQVELIRRAADHTGKRLSDYIRDLVVPQAARDLGEDEPNLPKIERGRYGSIVAKAAKARGMSREDFEAWAAQQLALEIASGGELDPDPGGGTTTRRTHPSGAAVYTNSAPVRREKPGTRGRRRQG